MFELTLAHVLDMATFSLLFKVNIKTGSRIGRSKTRSTIVLRNNACTGQPRAKSVLKWIMRLLLLGRVTQLLLDIAEQLIRFTETITRYWKF